MSELEAIRRWHENPEPFRYGYTEEGHGYCGTLLRLLDAARAEEKRLNDELDEAALRNVKLGLDLQKTRAELVEVKEAAWTFTFRFAEARTRYANRYGDNKAIGEMNFDKMPDDWPMENLIFTVGQFRRLAESLAKETP